MTTGGWWRARARSACGWATTTWAISAIGTTRRGPGGRYAFDLLAFSRWVDEQQLRLASVDTEVLLRFLASCREDGLAAATVNRRLAAVSGLFAFRAMRDPSAVDPMPTGPGARRLAAGQRDGLLGHLARPQPRSRLRARQPRRLPRGLDRPEVTALLASLLAWRDKAIAGLMLFSGLRSAEVLALTVADVDVGGGWVRVHGKGNRERRVPVDAEVAGWVQAYLLAERPDTEAGALFVVAKGPHRGRPLTPAGLRTIFRYHRARAGVASGASACAAALVRHRAGRGRGGSGDHPGAARSCPRRLHVGYIHLAPVRVRAAYDQARAVQRART